MSQLTLKSFSCVSDEDCVNINFILWYVSWGKGDKGDLRACNIRVDMLNYPKDWLGLLTKQDSLILKIPCLNFTLSMLSYHIITKIVLWYNLDIS